MRLNVILLPVKNKAEVVKSFGSPSVETRLLTEKTNQVLLLQRTLYQDQQLSIEFDYLAALLLLLQHYILEMNVLFYRKQVSGEHTCEYIHSYIYT